MPYIYVLDLSKGEMYWYNHDWAGTIYRSRLDGRSVESVIVNYNKPVCLALDPEGEKIYWAHTYASIYKCNMDGSNVEFLTNVIDYGAYIYDLTLDSVNEKVYWSRASEKSTVGRANFDGSRVEYPYYNYWFSFGVAVDPISEKIYME